MTDDKPFEDSPVDLPPSWAVVAFKEHVDKVSINGKKLPTKEYLQQGKYPVIDQGQAQIGGYSNDDSRVLEPTSPLIIFGDHTRALKYVTVPFVPGADGIKVIKPSPVFDSKLFFYFLYCVDLPNKGYARHYQHLEKTQLHLPPLAEQHRIVAEIETQFTRLDAGIAALKRVQANLKRYKASVLKAACEGKLVPQDPSDEPADKLLERVLVERRAKWEAGYLAKQRTPPKDDTWKAKYKEPQPPDTTRLPELPPGWVWASVDQLSFFITSGSRGWATYYTDHGSLFVRVGNFDRLSTAINLDKVTFVDPPQGAEGDRTRLVIGDLLVTITADVGMVGVVDNSVLNWGDAYINQHVSLIRLVNTEVAQYVASVIASESVQAQFREKQYGATKTGLNLDDLKTLIVPLPPLVEQQRIVAEIQRRGSLVESLEVSLMATRRRADRLRQSILREAFAGRLVPQDPNDEPASELLKRIRAEREQRKKKSQ